MKFRPMEKATLEILLNKVESDTLDFKTDQYEFYSASDDQKSELLKDVLTFANGWKETDAHIIIGVREKDGRAALVPGVTVHLADNDVQQFVNSKTNKPVNFAVETLQCGVVELDVITIDKFQARPIYCRRTFGRVKERVVYVRRGSSTAVADPDEVSAMGKMDALAELAPVPTVAFEFGDPDRRVRLGAKHKIISTTLREGQPEPPRPIQPSPRILPAFVTNLGIVDPLAPKSEDWIRYLKPREFFSPLGFWITNSGRSNISNARIEVRFPRSGGLKMVKRGDGPKQPDYGMPVDFTHLHDSLVLHEEPDAFFVQFEYARLQPKVQLWSPGLVYVGATENVDIMCPVSVFADDIANPITSELCLGVEARERVYTKAEVARLMGAM